ncbi:MAG TPA: hypothetical protein VGH44_02275 [Candidatus Saccharimonadia bacterium]
MLVFPRLNHKLSGRLSDHRDTSYALLVFMLLVAGLFLGSITRSALAVDPSVLCSEQDNQNSPINPGVHNACADNNINVNAVVPPPRPSKPAIITSPTGGQSFSTNPVTVTGTCPAGALIKVFTNGILVGSVICSASGHFTVPVDLVIGRNDLTALPFNTIDQQGPTGNTVTVTLNEPPGGPGFSTELLLQSENYYRGTTPGQEITWPIEIVGGQAPYAVSVDWGDGTTDLITRLAPGPFTVKHTYQKVGTGYLNTFPLIIRATDGAGHTAYLQLTTIVNPAKGATTSGSGASNNNSALNKLIVIWPIWIVLLLMIISFWLGERREKHIMEKRLAALA